MAFLKTLWSLFAVILTILFVALIAGPALIWNLLQWRSKTRHPSDLRADYSAWMFRWARPTFALFRYLMGITVRFRFPAPPEDGPRPAIIVSNHQSSSDILLLWDLLPRMGFRDVRWVMKDSLGRIPIIGTICRGHGSALIDRKDRAGSTARITEAAKLADADDASMVLFPEGTRWVPREGGYPDPLGGPPFIRVRPPKLAGFIGLQNEMLFHELVVLYIRWDGDVSAKTIFQFGKLVGRSVTVDAVRHPHRAGTLQDPIAWLNEQWRDIDEYLSTAT